PGMDIIRRVWPDENPFTANRYDLLRATALEVGTRRGYTFNAYSDARSLFRYEMHVLQSEISGNSPIRTSTALAAWNAATYVAQIEDERLVPAMTDNRYLDATRSVLKEHQGLWFINESFCVSRKPE